MTEIEHYRGGTPAHMTDQGVPALPPATNTDGWIQVVADVAQLAQQIANTEFVPDAMRGKPAAVTAAILAGREMGVGPMTALQHIHVIKGKPGQSAHLMRGLVLAAGHEIDYVEATDSRAVIRGRRAGETDWTVVEFTAQQAKQARIDLGGYPADKLVARATARLCRRKFADVISGLAYSVEELQDGDAQLIEDTTPAALESAGPKPARTAQRSTRQAKPRTAAATPRAAAPAAAAPPPEGPPLPGEDEATTAPPQEDQPELADTDPATKQQNNKMHALFREAQVSDRDERLKLTGLLLNRELDTSKGLTVADARSIIDALAALKASGHADGLAGAVNDLLNTAALVEADNEQTTDQAELPSSEGEQ